MKKIFILIVVALLGVTLSATAQQYQETVYLKNGSVIKGVVIEQTPGQSIKVQTSDGSIFAYQMDEVDKIAKGIELKTKPTKAKKPLFNWETKGYRSSGYAWSIEAEYTTGKSFKRPQYIGLSTTHGYQFNPYIFVGGGAEFQFALDEGWMFIPTGTPDEINNGSNRMESVLYDREIAGSDIGAVIFANMRLNLFDNKYTPYFDLRAGYSTSAKGIYLSPMIGGSLGRFDIGIGLLCQTIKFNNSHCDYIYDRYAKKWKEDDKRGPESTNKFEYGFNVRLGVSF